MRYLLASIALAGCSWTTFDDLGKEAWAQSTQSPNIGSTDYAVAITGSTASSTGGQLSVLSSDSVSYSTLSYDPSGKATLGANPQRLGQFFITSLGTQPIFVSNSSGECAAVAQASNGQSTYVVVYNGCASAPGATPIQSAAPPDAAAYIGSTLVVAAGANLFVVTTAGVQWCAATDDTGTTPLQASGLGADDANVYAWAAGGKLLQYKLTDLMTCVQMSTMPTAGTAITTGGGAAVDTGFMPATGASVQIVGSSTSATEWAVLAGHAPQSATGRVFSAKLVAPRGLVGSPYMADGISSSVTGTLGGMGPFVAMGFLGNGTGGIVELHALDTTTGAIDATVAEELADAQADSGEQFGRGLAIMEFNGTNILTVAAKSEVFAYFQTLLYPETRQ
jgi:hypothetical protein